MRIRVLATLFIVFFIGSCSYDKQTKSANEKIHFSLEEKGLGAPIELLFYDGEYHLFYQAKQDSLSYWGHAKSLDMIHWQHLPLVLYSDSTESIGSGSIVVDWDNTTGLGNENSPLIAYCINKNKTEDNTNQDDQSLLMAFSNDKGMTWEISENDAIVLQSVSNPVKDIKVIWHDDTQRWIMLVLTEYDLRFFSSVDMVNWDYENLFTEDFLLKKGAWEHLSFFPAETEKGKEQKWVLLISSDAGSPNEGSGTQYFIGDFDGYSFKKSQRSLKWLDGGTDNFAGVGLSNYFNFGKPLYYLGWMYNRSYGNNIDSVKHTEFYTFPRELILTENNKNYFLRTKPIEKMGETPAPKMIAETEFSGKLEFKEKLDIPLEINLLFDVTNRLHFDFAEAFGIQFSNQNGEQLIVGYNNRRHIFFISEQNSSSTINGFYQERYLIDQTLIDLKIIIDNSSVELFAMDGQYSLTKKSFPSNDWNTISLFAEGGNIKLKEGSMTELGVIWK